MMASLSSDIAGEAMRSGGEGCSGAARRVAPLPTALCEAGGLSKVGGSDSTVTGSRVVGGDR
jgi:hypothetical protein